VIRLAQWVWKLRDELRDPCLEKQKDGKEGEGGNIRILMMLLHERVCVCERERDSVYICGFEF